jgi:ribosomal protein S8
LWFAEGFFLVLLFFQIADFIARIHVASSKNKYTVKVNLTKINLRLLVIFNIEGFIEGFRIFDNFILIFLKYNFLNSFLLFKNIKIVSLPSKRVF